MFNRFYRWRYERRQRSGSFKLPETVSKRSIIRFNFSSYLSQTSVRGRTFNRFDLPRRRRRRWKLAFLLGVAVVLLWVIVESVRAFALFRA